MTTRHTPQQPAKMLPTATMSWWLVVCIRPRSREGLCGQMTTSPLQAQPATRVIEVQQTLPPATLAPGAMLPPTVSPALATRSSEWVPKHNVRIYEKQTRLLLRKTCAEAFAFLPTGASFNVASPHTQLQPRHASHRVNSRTARYMPHFKRDTQHGVTRHTSHVTRHTPNAQQIIAEIAHAPDGLH